jgi:hypothetical protein
MHSQFYANPLSPDKRGFYFSSAEELQQKLTAAGFTDYTATLANGSDQAKAFCAALPFDTAEPSEWFAVFTEASGDDDLLMQIVGAVALRGRPYTVADFDKEAKEVLAADVWPCGLYELGARMVRERGMRESDAEAFFDHPAFLRELGRLGYKEIWVNAAALHGSRQAKQALGESCFCVFTPEFEGEDASADDVVTGVESDTVIFDSTLAEYAEELAQENMERDPDFVFGHIDLSRLRSHLNSRYREFICAGKTCCIHKP